MVTHIYENITGTPPHLNFIQQIAFSQIQIFIEIISNVEFILRFMVQILSYC